MPGGTYNPQIVQGEVFTKTVVYKINGSPVDLTGYTGDSQIRAGYKSVATDLTIAFTSPRSSGELTFSLTAAQTAALSYTTGVWDLFLTSPTSGRFQLLAGTPTIREAATRTA